MMTFSPIRSLTAMFLWPQRLYFWEVVASVAGNLIGGALGSKGAEKAADASAEAAKLQVEEARRQYDQSRADLSPWRTSGMGANNWLSYLTQPDAPNPKRLNRIDRAKSRIAELQGYLGLTPAAATGGNAMSGYDNGVRGPLNIGPSADPNAGPTGLGTPRPTSTTTTGVAAAPAAATAAMTPEQKAAHQKELDSLNAYLLKAEKNAGKRGKKDLVTKFLRQTPGYKFNFNEGQKAVERSALTGGRGGKAMKAITKWGQNYADQEYDDWVGMLQFQSGSGQNAAAMTGSLGAQSSGQIQNALGNYGQAQAAGAAGQADSWGNAFGNVANDAMWAYYNSRNQTPNYAPVEDRSTSANSGSGYRWG